MRKVKILVVENKTDAAKNICGKIEKLGYSVLEAAKNYETAIDLIKKDDPDIVIISINLSGNKTGIDLAKTIKKEYQFPFIFVISNENPFAINLVKEVIPPAYLITPFTKNDLFNAIEIALHNFSQKTRVSEVDNLIIKDSIFVKEKGSYKKIHFDDILYLKSDHVYVEVFLKQNLKQVIRISLNEILESLDNTFLRVHRGYIINTNYLVEVDQTSVKIMNKEVPLGRKYKDDLLKRINSI